MFSKAAATISIALTMLSRIYQTVLDVLYPHSMPSSYDEGCNFFDRTYICRDTDSKDPWDSNTNYSTHAAARTNIHC